MYLHITANTKVASPENCKGHVNGADHFLDFCCSRP
jgi:hypothetical protein